MATLIVVEDLAASSVRGRGGHALYVLQTILGLARLGHRVVFVECLDEHDDAAVASFTALMARWWDLDESALLAPGIERRIEVDQLERLVGQGRKKVHVVGEVDRLLEHRCRA